MVSNGLREALPIGSIAPVLRAQPFVRVAFVLSGVVACAGKSEPSSNVASAPHVTATSSFAPFFPLEEGKIYHYVTSEGEGTGMLVAKVHRSDATHGELRLSNATKRFRFEPDGVAYDTPSGPYLLKSPVEVGNAWPGEHGGTTTITSVDASVTVPAGQYASCLQTVEEGGRPPGSRYETTYCPGVGMVLLVVRAAGSEARAELKSYGMPVKIE